MDENRLTDDEAKFCLLFVNGSDKVAGNARKCYQAIYPEVDDAVAQMKAREILAKESAKERIKELRRVELYSADSLRPALTEKLMKIADECSDSLYISTKTGLPANPAAMRSVAVSAIKTLSDMLLIIFQLVVMIMVEMLSLMSLCQRNVTKRMRRESYDKSRR